MSYPYARYSVVVSHFTARRSTVIEWMILEAVWKCSEMPKYANVSARSVFQDIFMVADADLLVLPCILELQDLGALVAEGVVGSSKLEHIPMRNLRLTESGREMQRRGLLPGVKDESIFPVVYDLFRQRLVLEGETKYIDAPDGIPIMETGSMEEIVFPTAQIKKMLDDEKHKKNSRFSWLMPNTRVESIGANESSLGWKSKISKIQAGTGMTCYVEGIDDPQFTARALQSLSCDPPAEYCDIPYAQIADPDKEVREFFSLTKLPAAIGERMKSDPVFLVSKRFYRAEAFGANKEKRGSRVKIAIVDSGNELTVTVRNKQIIAEIPARVLPDEVVYLSSATEVHLCRFCLKAAGCEQEAALGFFPSDPSASVEDIISRVAAQYAGGDYRMAFVLYELGGKDAFLECVKKACADYVRIDDRVDLLDQVNQMSLQLYNQKLVPANILADILIDPAQISAEAVSFSRALALLEGYGEMNVFRQNDALYQGVLQQILEQLPPAEDLTELHALWKHIKQVKRAHLSWICQNSLHRSLYAGGVLEEIMAAFGSEDFFALMADEYTPVEQVFYQMKQVVTRVLAVLPELNPVDNCSEESVREAILAHKDAVRGLQEEIRTWHDCLDRFEVKVCALNSLEGRASYFSRTLLMMDRVTGALSVFCDDSTVKYRKIVIVDTSTLMKRPEIISWFEDEKAMLIIPQKVLSELDGLKSNENEETAYQAREVIRLIDNHRAYDWLNTKETSDVTLLNSDLDRDSGDSKILSIAIRYIVKNPIILTDDINFRNIADAQGIIVMDSDGYEKAKKYEVETTDKPRKSKKKKQR